MIYDITSYFHHEINFITEQHVVRIDLLFYRFVVKHWKSNHNGNEYEQANKIIANKIIVKCSTFFYYDFISNHNGNEYEQANKIIVKECTTFYFECWQSRNELFYSEQKQIKMLKQWSGKIKD